MIAFLCYSQTIPHQEKRPMDKVIHLSTVLRCDVHSAYQMFTDNKFLESWLTSVAEIEAQVGGKYELFWQPDDRENNSTIGCKVTALQPDKFLSFEWKSPEQFKHFANNADPLTHVVVFFISLGDSTEVHLIHSGWRSSDQWEEARQWQEKAWLSAFNQLRKKTNEK
jgi:uncharacterized protein YndB with AHSA1/START domain